MHGTTVREYTYEYSHTSHGSEVPCYSTGTFHGIELLAALLQRRSSLVMAAEAARLVQVRAGDFGTEPPVLKFGGGSATDVSHSVPIGGVFEGHGSRKGHNVVWCASGNVLELNEMSMLPRVAVTGGELALHFPSNLLPDPRIYQLGNGDLLVSVGTQAPRGAMHMSALYQGGYAASE